MPKIDFYSFAWAFVVYNSQGILGQSFELYKNMRNFNENFSVSINFMMTFINRQIVPNSRNMLHIICRRRNLAGTLQDYWKIATYTWNEIFK